MNMLNTRARKYAVALGLLAPALIVYTVFFVVPIIDTFKLSFYSWNGIKTVPRAFVGLKNYFSILSDPTFFKSAYNSLVFLIVTIGVIMPCAFTLAYILFSKIRFSDFFKTVFYFPTILPMAATGLMWSFMLYKNGGAVNTLLQILHLPSNTDWLGNQTLVIWVVALVNSWMFIGHNMLFFLAALMGISTDVIEASIIDGASGFKYLWYIIIPGAKEGFKIFLVMAVSGCIKVFDIIYVMTGGGPGNASDVPAILLYKESFIYSKFGYGSAIGVIILVISVGIAFLLNTIFDKMD